MTADRSTPILRPLTGTDSDALRAFTCETYREPWTLTVQELIREQLPDHLHGSVSALGLWLDDTLCGVAAWRVDGAVCRSIAVAVRVGYRRRGLGGFLKDAVLAQARAAGATSVVSFVHWDNEGMIEVNVARGANLERVAGDRDYCLCVIPLDP